MTGVCEYQRFDTAGVPPRDRFDYWRTWYGEAVDVPMRLTPHGSAPPDFHASADALAVGGLEIVEVRCDRAFGAWDRQATATRDLLRLAMIAPTPGGTARWHGHVLSLDGGATTLLGRTGGTWHAPGGLHGIQVNLPRAGLPVTDAELDRLLDRHPDPPRAIMTALVGPALTGMSGHLAELHGADAAELAATWTALISLLLRAMTGGDIASTTLAPARRLQAERYIQAHLADPRLSPESVAAALRLSRRSLYALLSDDGQNGGSGVAAHIRRQRLATAHRLLADPAHTYAIHVIGALVGLPDPAHFARQFRAAYGCAPSDVRDAAHAETATLDPATG